jgi:F0F1-type ATP synthase membrane subunit b/b'
MWPIISVALEIIVGLIVITQIIIPGILDYPLFWLFKKKIVIHPKIDEEEPSLNDELKSAKKTADEAKKKVNDIREKVDKHHREAEEMKDEADDLI